MKNHAMKFFVSLLCILNLAFVCIAEDLHNVIPDKGYVPNELTAVSIALAVANAIYGEQEIQNQKPLTAQLDKDKWVVQGTAPNSIYYRGGVVLVEIDKLSGRILRVSHGK